MVFLVKVKELYMLSTHIMGLLALLVNCLPSTADRVRINVSTLSAIHLQERPLHTFLASRIPGWLISYAWVP
jgi:hypothetical protein